MKSINNFVSKITSHHLQTRFLLTPIAIAVYTINLVDIKMIYLFGVRVFRKNMIK